MDHQRFKIGQALRIRSSGVVMLFVGILLSGCASSRPSLDTSPLPAPSHGVEARLRAEIEGWHGTPHQWGGITTRGADCSGFVYSVYRDVFSRSLPRTTEEQVRIGRAVRTSDLQAGDLVFFKPTTRTNHVGIYLSDGYFAHISSSRGLMYSHLDERYWRRAYWTSRRVLDAEAAPGSIVEVDREPPRAGTAGSASRGGW